jgi:hypothetical protein
MFFINYFFQPVFGRFWQKKAAVQPQIFLGQPFLSGAGFELFCRIFGRLATVSSIRNSMESAPFLYYTKIKETQRRKAKKIYNQTVNIIAIRVETKSFWPTANSCKNGNVWCISFRNI